MPLDYNLLAQSLKNSFPRETLNPEMDLDPRNEEALTSEAHPLCVDWLPAKRLRTAGNVGMSLAPGKRHRGFTGRWDRDLKMDLRRLRDDYKINCIVSLMEPHEYRLVGIPMFFDEAHAHNLDVIWYPIEDMKPPLSIQRTRDVVASIIARADAGENLVIHCRGGIGRTGTIAACVLAMRKCNAETAIREVQKARQGALTRESQQAFVRAFAKNT